MDDKTKGAWLIHHGQKLQTTLTQDFDAIGFAAKCGTLLSAISAERQSQLNSKKVEALAKAAGISVKSELPQVLGELNRQRLIQTTKTHIEVLGLTGHAVLGHTATIFSESDHEAHEEAVLEVSELASESPVTESYATQFVSDTYHLTNADARNALHLGTQIGFFDSEPIAANEKLLFNGKLFKRDEANKVNAIISALSQKESNSIIELNQRLQKSGCIPLDAAKRVVGADLFAKLHSIGMFDVSVVGNDTGKSYFVTRPAAFSKFSNTIADDALDLAKAFVASLTYGMTISSFYRGRITMISALMRKLIGGSSVGPATAIGSDYRALELKGVVKVEHASGSMFTMKLLKPEVGRLALAVIETGDITAEGVLILPGANVTEYQNPETTREVRRKTATPALKASARNLLNEIRTGGLSK